MFLQVTFSRPVSPILHTSEKALLTYCIQYTVLRRPFFSTTVVSSKWKISRLHVSPIPCWQQNRRFHSVKPSIYTTAGDTKSESHLISYFPLPTWLRGAQCCLRPDQRSSTQAITRTFCTYSCLNGRASLSVPRNSIPRPTYIANFPGLVLRESLHTTRDRHDVDSAVSLSAADDLLNGAVRRASVQLPVRTL